MDEARTVPAMGKEAWFFTHLQEIADPEERENEWMDHAARGMLKILDGMVAGDSQGVTLANVEKLYLDLTGRKIT